MTSLSEKIKNFFTEQPLPSSVFQVTSSCLSGIHFSHQDRKVKSHFILPLQKGLVESSFYKNNIKDQDRLKEAIEEKAKQIEGFTHSAALLLPELSQKVFVFTFDSLPPSRDEREKIIRFRVKKQMPLLPDDNRMSFEVSPGNERAKTLVSVARSSVIQEYEDFFLKLRFKIRRVGIPSLSLLNLIDLKQERDFAAINIEEDAFSLVVVIDSGLFLYRQKPFIPEPGGEYDPTKMAANIAQEVKNTLNFVEDKEKRTVSSLWIRQGLVSPDEDMIALLEEKFAFPLKRIEKSVTFKLEGNKKRILAPLIGQVL